jgi:pyruvate kinase
LVEAAAPSPPSVPGLPIIPVDGHLLAGAKPDDVIELSDSRGRRRRLDVATVHEGAVEATSDRTVYAAAGTPLECRRAGKRVGRGHIGSLPPAASFIRLERGDHLIVRLGDAPGSPAVVADDGSIGTPATISCDLGDVFRAVAVGDRMLFDDGAIETVVERVTHDGLEVIVQRPESAKLKAEKGINLPDTTLRLWGR